MRLPAYRADAELRGAKDHGLPQILRHRPQTRPPKAGACVIEVTHKSVIVSTIVMLPFLFLVVFLLLHPGILLLLVLLLL